MRTIAVAAVVATAGLAGAVSRGAVQVSSGVLRGATQISFGCPGPTTEPPCNPWRPFPRARFSVARRDASGALAPGSAVVVTSNASARFSVRLAAGWYVITPLPQAVTIRRGGPPVNVRVRAGAVTAVLVRYIGAVQME